MSILTHQRLITHTLLTSTPNTHFQPLRRRTFRPLKVIRGTHPDADELVVEDDPGEEVDEGDVGGVEGHDVGAVQDPQGVHVHVVGDHPQQAEEAAPGHELTCGARTRHVSLGERERD